MLLYDRAIFPRCAGHAKTNGLGSLQRSGSQTSGTAMPASTQAPRAVAPPRPTREQVGPVAHAVHTSPVTSGSYDPHNSTLNSDSVSLPGSSWKQRRSFSQRIQRRCLQAAQANRLLDSFRKLEASLLSRSVCLSHRCSFCVSF